MAVGFDMSTSSTSLFPWTVSKHRGTLHPIAFSTLLLLSLPPCLYHLLTFLVAFSTPLLFSLTRRPLSTPSPSSPSSPLRHCVFHVIVMPIHWHSPRRWLSPMPGSYCSSCHGCRRVSCRGGHYAGSRCCVATVKLISLLSNPHHRCQTQTVMFGGHMVGVVVCCLSYSSVSPWSWRFSLPWHWE